MCVKNAALALAALATSSSAQTTFLDAPEQKFSTKFLPMGQGNGIVFAPDNSAIYVTASDGTIGAISPDDGSVFWTYKPETGGSLLSGTGEASVAVDGSYLVYGVTENLNRDGENCMVVALSPLGEMLYSAQGLKGSCKGTPHITSDGNYVFVTHNSELSTIGHFSVLKNDENGEVLWDVTDTTGPFSQAGFYRNPLEGNFGAGRGNTNDLAVWSHAPTPQATTGESGSMFAFQLPFNYVPDLGTDVLAVTTLIPIVEWRSTNPPLLTAFGQQLFWPVTRAQLRAWVNTRFTSTASASVSFERGQPSFLAPQCTPAVDNSNTPSIVCTGGADSQFICMNSADLTELWTLDVAGLVLSDPIFSTEGDRVYFAQDRGVIIAANPGNGNIFFESSTRVPLLSNIAMSADGAYLYYGDAIGNLVAWKVAEPEVQPTGAPISQPTPEPTIFNESIGPTAKGLDAPSKVPSAGPTEPRVESPTSALPTVKPTADSTSAASCVSAVSVIGASVIAAAFF